MCPRDQSDLMSKVGDLLGARLTTCSVMSTRSVPAITRSDSIAADLRIRL
jgi:hypothetical protein